MAKRIPSYAKQFKNHSVMVVNQNQGTVDILPVWNLSEQTIETPDEMYPVSHAQRFYNNQDGGFTFVYNMDIPARVEASNLVQLRRSEALKAMFDYDKGKPFDIFKLLPWVVTLVALFV